MAIRLSEYFRIEPLLLEKLDVFDTYLGVDTPVFLDPCLLRHNAVPEFQNSHERLQRYFETILKLLTASTSIGDRAFREAAKRLQFPELRGVAIGYGTKSADGNAIGPKLAERLAEASLEIIRLGVVDPMMFELLGLFEEGFGADRLSDMAVDIVKEDIYAFTQRVTKTIGYSNVVEVQSSAGKYLLPLGPDSESIKLLPSSLLRSLPVATDWSEIADVISYNEALRNRVNQLIAAFWKSGYHPSKHEFREAVFAHPDRLKLLLEAYKAARPSSYNFSTDPEGLVSWYSVAAQFAQYAPLELHLSAKPTIDDVEEVVREIVIQFRRSIEESGLYAHLYNDDGTQRHERYAQLLFFATADVYCRMNDLDLSREPNAGRGPVDFKISGGYQSRVLVEIKLSSNPNLLHGFEKQVRDYEKSENTDRSFYVIIRVRTGDNDQRRIDEVLKAEAEAKEKGKRVPEVVVIDGTKKASASKRG